MSWVLLFLAACALALLALRHRRLTLQVARLEHALAEMAEGRRPASLVFHDAPTLRRASLFLEKIADHQTALAHQIAEDAFSRDAILASMAEGVAVLDADRKIRLANDSLRRLFAIELDPVGKTILGALREAAVEEVAVVTLQTGAPHTREISMARSGSLVPLHLEVSAAPIAAAKGAPRGAVLVFHDISRLRQLEEIRRQFVSNVSHELRTPLSIFYGYLENLLDHPSLPEDERTDVLRIMQRHSRRLNAILEDLLTLARLETRQDALDVAEINLEAFLGGIVKDWSLKFAEKGIVVALDLGHRTLRGDPSRLEQVFTNLIENAVRYVPAETGRIRLRSRLREGVVEIRVEDNGPGIPPSDLVHIFERFYRVEKARSRDGGGTGLGLSIVKHIVALHGGSVHAESPFGEGTAIVLKLPS